MARTFLTKKKLGLNQSSKIPGLKVQLFGQWEETVRVLQKISPAVKEASIKAQIKVADQIARKVKAHIRNQDLKWPPLSAHYAQKKSEAGAGSKTLYAYGNYYRAIEVWQKAAQHLVFVGVKNGQYTRELSGKRSKLQIAQIAIIHEFSSGRKIPRRPLWNPTIAEIGGVKGIKQMYVNSLIARLRMKGIPIREFKNIL